MIFDISDINQIWKRLVKTGLHKHFDIHRTGAGLSGPLALRNRTIPFVDVMLRDEDDAHGVVALARKAMETAHV